MTTIGAGTPSNEPARATSRAGRDLPAAIAVSLSIGSLLIATLVFATRYWVVIVAIVIAVATHEVVRRLREAGYLIPIIPLLVGGQAIVWLTWPYRTNGALAGFVGTVLACLIWRLTSSHTHNPPPAPCSTSPAHIPQATCQARS